MFPLLSAHTDGNGAWKDGPTAVVILTYYRSGSTFLGDIINQSKDVFYVFEPLFYLTHVSTLNYYNRSKRYNILINVNEWNQLKVDENQNINLELLL